MKYLNLVVDLMPMTLARFNAEQSCAGPQPQVIFAGDNLNRLKRFCHKMFEGLAILHERGVAHRDIKPENILVDPSENSVRICDFGSAKQLPKHNYGFVKTEQGATSKTTG